MNPRSPLEIVQHSLTIYTARNPAHTAAVLHMMAESIATLGDFAGLEFAQRLSAGLDTRAGSPTHFGSKQAAHAQRLGESILDPETENVHRYGSLSVIGAMSLAYTAESQQNPSRVSSRSAQAIGAVGRELLWGVYRDVYDQHDADVRDVADALLHEPPVDPEDLAIELLPLTEEVQEVLAEPTQDAAFVQFVETGYGQYPDLIGETKPMPVKNLGLNQNTIAKMNWLDLSGQKKLPTQTVAADGKLVAYLVDLTPYHPVLAKMMQELAGYPKLHGQFCNRLAFDIINYTRNPDACKRLPSYCQKLPTYKSGNTSTSNDELIRGYFAHIGTHNDGTPVVGLLAGVRTKERQRKVLGIITIPKINNIQV